MARDDVGRIQSLVSLGVDPTTFCIPLVVLARAAATMATLAHARLGFFGRGAIRSVRGIRLQFLVGVNERDSRIAIPSPRCSSRSN